MKQSEFKKAIKEEIIDILEAVSSDDIKNQQDYNDELAKTAELSKEAGLTESVNPDLEKKIISLVRSCAKEYDIDVLEAFKAIHSKMSQMQDKFGFLDSLKEGNDSDKFQDDGYVDKKDVDSTSDVYTHNDPESMAFEQIEDEDEDKEPSTYQIKGD